MAKTLTLYKHTRSGNIVEIITTAKHTETDEELVIYKDFPKSDNDIIRTHARPISNFFSKLEDGTERFVRVDKLEDIFTADEINKMKNMTKNEASSYDYTVATNAFLFL